MLNLLKTIKYKINYCVDILFSKLELKRISSYLHEKGVLVLYVELPNINKISGLTAFEKERINSWSFDFNNYRNEIDKLRYLYDDNISEEYILSIFDGGVVVKGNKRHILLDFQTENQHIINGRRITVNQPVSFHNTIYTHGACTWRGTGVEDKETIASFLQGDINHEFLNSYRVINSAIGRGSDLRDDYQVIKEQQYKKGDIVILGSHGAAMDISESFFEHIGMRYLSVSHLFNRPHSYGEWFNDALLHTNKRGNKVIADAIFAKLKSEKLFIDISDIGHSIESLEVLPNKRKLLNGEKIYGNDPGLIKFIDKIKQFNKGTGKSLCGCIVMNCNPFTLGHRYLIECAASKVDYLYIFVVEENKSYFSFSDRFELVKQGTKDLANVVVLPSGNFIISATTFPGYFYKDNIKNVKIDCSNDINVFAQYIAPALNISIRFVGNEPLDPITNQYNDAMAEILPKYGIQLRVINRKSSGNDVISASLVRKYLEKGEFDKIKAIVPFSTYNYLINSYNKHND